MSVDTAQIFAVVSLLMKVHSEEDAMDLKGIVSLLEKMVLFPELESHRREMQGFLEEAKCQVKCECMFILFALCHLYTSIMHREREREIHYLC